jgi:glucose/arabinose dehydrogenase/PKD repeat protein
MRSVSIPTLLNQLFLLAALLWPLSTVTSRGVLHNDGFIEELVASERSFTGAFIPNPQEPDTKPPMLLLSMKRGIVNVMTNPDESTTTQQILDIEHKLCTNGERGFQSIVPHPNFAENNWLYIYYTAFSEDCLEDPVFGPRNRLSRLKMDPQTLRIMNETEQVLMEGAPTHKFFHNGGAIKFGNDGKLYVTTGDGGGDGQGTSQDLTNLHGSILRLNDDGSVPSDNPLTYQGGYNGVPCGQTGGVIPRDAPNNAVCSEIFSYGFRNPFRIVMDPAETEKTRFYVNDVGGSVWEEISEAGTDFAGKNYGWPRYEGPCKFGKTDDCPLYDPSSNIEKRDQYVEPLYYYEHEQDREGGCIAGGAFVPEGIWPAEYKYVYADFIFHSIYNLVEDPENECRSCLPPIPKYRNETFYTSVKEEDQHENYARVVDIFFGPYKDTQALYVFKMGEGNNVWRIRYTGSDNIPPVAKIKVDSSSVDVGDIVAFDGTNSFDPEELGLEYKWDFGDGESFSREANPIHAYGNSGQYTVRLAVTDSANHTQSSSVVIVVGSPPTLSITSPAEGDEFFVGEILTLSGVANHANGDPLSDTQISWEVRRHHADHWHPFLDVKVGNDMLLFPAPEPEDYLAATNSYLEIIMYATDANGLVSATSRNIQPRIVELCVDSEPQGLEIFVDEFPIVTPLRIASWVNHDLRIRTPMFQDMNGNISNSTFLSWSDGSIADDRQIRLLPDGNTGLLASFCVDGDNTCITEVKTRAADKFLMARCPSKAPTESPTALATGSPTAAPTEKTTASPMEEEEDRPVDLDSIESEGEEPSEKDPIPERPIDAPFGEDNSGIWEFFEGQDSGAGSTVSMVVIFALSSLATLAVLTRI